VAYVLVTFEERELLVGGYWRKDLDMKLLQPLLGLALCPCGQECGYGNA